MKTRLTENDLARIVRRVINEQKTVADQSTIDSYNNFKKEIKKLTGIDSSLASKVSLALFGLSCGQTPKGYGCSSTGEDFETRLKNYDKVVTDNSLNLPSSSIIKLFKQIV